MDPFLSVLLQLGVSVAANAFYGFLKGIRTKNPTPTDFEFALQDFLHSQGADIPASSVIKAFIEHGLLNSDSSGHLVVSGEIIVTGEDAESVTGIDAGGKPTVLKPGTTVNVSAKRAKNVTGVKN